MRVFALVCMAGLALGVRPSGADALFGAVPGDLRYATERALAQDVVVYDTTEYDGRLRRACYYSWDAASKHVVAKCRTAKSGEVLRVVRSTPAERGSLVDLIKRSGIRAEITTSKGEVFDYFGLLADYEAPPGYALLSSGNLGGSDDETQFRNSEPRIMLIEPGKPNPSWFDFSAVASVRFEGDVARVSTRNGLLAIGQWVGLELSSGKPRLRVVLRGINGEGVPVNIKLDQVFSIAIR